MKRLTVLLAALSFGGACFAELSSNQITRLKTLCSSSYRPPRSFTNEVSWFLKREGLTLEDVLPEAERLALAANDNQNPGRERRKGEGGGALCDGTLCFLGTFGDKRHLPVIERLALTAHDRGNRVQAVQAHVAICGFDSFPLVKRAIDAQSDTVEGLSTRRQMLDWFLRRMSETELSESQKKELHDYLLAAAMSTTNAPSLVQADEFLQRSLPAYTNSRQRLYYSGKQNMRDPTGQMPGYFAPIKTGLEKLPLSDLVDLRERFPDLPPLPKENDDGKPLMYALAACAAIVACACAAWLAIRWRKPRGTE